ncbi:MAG: hypothetical protein QM757_07865 [Paludibaculum sp.]
MSGRLGQSAHPLYLTNPDRPAQLSAAIRLRRLIRFFVLILLAKQFQILGFEDPAAVAAANIVDPIPAGYQFSTIRG